MTAIKRYFSEKHFEKFKKDFSFLMTRIKNSNGELDFQIRPDNRFNIYHKGNSLAEVKIQENNYVVKIHKEFKADEVADKKDSKNRFPKKRFKYSGNYLTLSLNPEELPKFFQVAIIDGIAKNIKTVNNCEEITFEQSLVTDNLESEKIIIIDRQVAGGGLSGILDSLALKKIDPAKYRFVVLEVKLGNNKELKGQVANQIEEYIKIIEKNIDEFRKCYEINYAQKKAAGLFPSEFPDKIAIDDKVEGKIVVGLYSKIGKKYIKELCEKHPKWKNDVIQFSNNFIADKKL